MHLRIKQGCYLNHMITSQPIGAGSAAQGGDSRQGENGGHPKEEVLLRSGLCHIWR